MIVFRPFTDKYERQLHDITSKLEPVQAQGKRESELPDGSRCPTSSKIELFATHQKSQYLSSSAPPSRDSIDLNVGSQDQELSKNFLCPKSQKLPVPLSPSSRLMLLRQEYQQLHRERCLQYPLDAEDDKREQCQRELERKVVCKDSTRRLIAYVLVFADRLCEIESEML